MFAMCFFLSIVLESIYSFFRYRLRAIFIHRNLSVVLFFAFRREFILLIVRMYVPNKSLNAHLHLMNKNVLISTTFCMLFFLCIVQFYGFDSCIAHIWINTIHFLWTNKR